MLILGIDTGGTYTDSVIWDRDSGKILCKTKELTTQHDLIIGIQNCLQSLPAIMLNHIAMVCLSTTLATNAIVEGKGCRTGLLLLGGKPEGEIPADVSVELDARLDIRGGVSRPLEEKALSEAILSLKDQCEAVAVSGYASIRNPLHEVHAAAKIRELLKLPVVCAHELSGNLGFYERTVTAVLNARLIPVIDHLITTVYKVMEQMGIQAPVMIVRGNGSLMRADYAMERPVETILSGPAASVIGARYLSCRQNCLVVDMGGTTTDIASLRDGQCEVSKSGTYLAGFRTHVKALEICTFGLGGDSEIRTDDNGQVQIGPRRIIPFCRAVISGERNGLTPTDVLHVTGEYQCFDTAAAESGMMECFENQNVHETASGLRSIIVQKLAACCQESLTVFSKDKSPILIGVGAPAGIWLRDAAKTLEMDFQIPEYSEVANAVGAAVGQIIESSHALIRKNRINDSYYIFTETKRQCALDFKQSIKEAKQIVYSQTGKKARDAGAVAYSITIEEHEITDSNGGFIEFRINAVAIGYPYTVPGI